MRRQRWWRLVFGSVWVLLGGCGLLPAAVAGEILDNPFTASVALTEHAGQPALAVLLAPGPQHYLYDSAIAVFGPDESEWMRLSAPEPVEQIDPILGEPDFFHDSAVTLVFGPPEGELPEWAEVHFMGCNPTFCYPPEVVRFRLSDGQRIDSEIEPDASDTDRPPLLAGFEEAAREVGFLNVAAFDAFLDVGTGAAQARRDRLRAAYRDGTFWLLLALILLGGLALNLTPCVLPMIPVNLAIIGATGGKDASRGRGFLLGLLYGLGMTLVYGALGVVALFAGAQFGTLNATWGFNLAITVLFGVLALAMFDVFSIDFSRFQMGLGKGRSHLAGGALALVAGGVAALLAGACVAPVVISVLLLSAEMFADGRTWGLLLPFALGAGMALPWPMAGAGLSIMPKPGAWMVRVKQVFGLLILGLALYYGKQAWSLAGEAWARTRAEAHDPHAEVVKLETAARRARREGKPLLIDFWATWCTSCMHMKRTTLQDDAIRQRLETEFVFHPFQAEQPRNPVTARVLEQLDIKGFPTYLVLRPADL